MKTLLTITLYISFLSGNLAAQHTSPIEYGISADLGRSYYDRMYYEDYRKFKNDGQGYISHFQSNYVWGVGFWIERHFNRSFSGLTQLTYHQTDILPDLFSQWYDSGFWYARETHHYAQAEFGMRWYINPQSKLIFFTEVKGGANMFVAAVDRPYHEEKQVNWKAYGYDRILPVASAAAGVKWRRFALMADYGHDLLRTRRDDPEKLGFMNKKTGILTQRINAKATFTIFK